MRGRGRSRKETSFTNSWTFGQMDWFTYTAWGWPGGPRIIRILLWRVPVIQEGGPSSSDESCMCAVERTESRGGRHPTALSGYFLKASSAFSLASWGLEFCSRLPSATEDAGVHSLYSWCPWGRPAVKTHRSSRCWRLAPCLTLFCTSCGSQPNTEHTWDFTWCWINGLICFDILSPEHVE